MRHADSLTKSESRRICLIFLHGIIVIGIIIGAYLAAVRGVEATSDCRWLHQFIAPVFGEKSILTVFRNTFLVSAAFCGALLFWDFLLSDNRLPPLCLSSEAWESELLLLFCT